MFGFYFTKSFSAPTERNIWLFSFVNVVTNLCLLIFKTLSQFNIPKLIAVMIHCSGFFNLNYSFFIKDFFYINRYTKDISVTQILVHFPSVIIVLAPGWAHLCVLEGEHTCVSSTWDYSFPLSPVMESVRTDSIFSLSRIWIRFTRDVSKAWNLSGMFLGI